MSNYDVIVVGAGPAGMMAAIAAAEQQARVLLLEKNKRIGKKLLLTGGGRCNVTNNRPVDDLIEHIPGNGRFLYSTFSQFSNYDIMSFFQENHVALKEEDHGRMFPVTDKSKTIVEALYAKLVELGVVIYTNTSVTRLLRKDGQVQGAATENEQFLAPCVILTTGGRAYPSTGSTGDGYRFAKKVGHTLAPLYPTESPLVSEEDFIQKRTLQGLSLQDVTLSVINEKGKILTSHTMDLLFTHFGLSGPAALRCSGFVNQELTKGADAVTVVLDTRPHQTSAELTADVKNRSDETPNKSVRNALAGFLPERLLDFFQAKAEIDGAKPIRQLTEKESETLVQLSKGFPIQIKKTFALEKSFVTGGGIHLKEVNPKTLESKLLQGLFFAGEILDINGYTGGYNVTAALATGHVAGTHAAEIASYMKF